MRLAIVISSLQIGGAEFMALSFADYWATHGHEVTLLAFEKDSGVQAAVPHPAVKLCMLKEGKGTSFPGRIIRFFGRIKTLRKALLECQPQIVVSLGDLMNVLSVLACRGTDIGCIIAERTTPPFAPLSPLLKFLRRRCYPRAKALVVQSKDAAKFFETWKQPKVQIIPNPLFLPKDYQADPIQTYGKRPQRIVSLGRLSPEKGLDTLLRVFAQTRSEFSDWELHIFGEGQERSKLEKLIVELGLEQSAFLRGLSHEPLKEFAQARIFVLPSHFEGFPSALVQAMASGCAVLSFKCPGAAREIIHDGQDGILVKNSDEPRMLEALRQLMRQPEHAERLTRDARLVTKRFAPEKIMPMWEKVFAQVKDDGK